MQKALPTLTAECLRIFVPLFRHCLSCRIACLTSLLKQCLLICCLLLPGLTAALNAPRNLSDWPFLDVSRKEYSAGVEYQLQRSAFSDHARKVRTIHLPLGAELKVNANDGRLEFPIGTVIEKLFYYLTEQKSDCLTDGSVRALLVPKSVADQPMFKCNVETRLLRKGLQGWEPSVYLWDAGQKTALLASSGASIPVSLRDGDNLNNFDYQVPGLGDCAQCHWGSTEGSAMFAPIGPSQVRRISFDDSHASVPASSLNASSTPSFKSQNLEVRAREYLDINCAHCHNPSGLASSSALFLNLDQKLNVHFGLCKRVVASGADYRGNVFTIVPGEPDKSILISRMISNQSRVKMPELGRAVTDYAGVELVSKWIASLQGDCQDEA